MEFSPTDFFGNVIHVDQRVAHIRRVGNSTGCDMKLVTEIIRSDNTVMICRVDDIGDPVGRSYPTTHSERLVIHPEDIL